MIVSFLRFLKPSVSKILLFTFFFLFLSFDVFAGPHSGAIVPLILVFVLFGLPSNLYLVGTYAFWHYILSCFLVYEYNRHKEKSSKTYSIFFTFLVSLLAYPFTMLMAYLTVMFFVPMIALSTKQIARETVYKNDYELYKEVEDYFNSCIAPCLDKIGPGIFLPDDLDTKKSCIISQGNVCPQKIDNIAQNCDKIDKVDIKYDCYLKVSSKFLSYDLCVEAKKEKKYKNPGYICAQDMNMILPRTHKSDCSAIRNLAPFPAPLYFCYKEKKQLTMDICDELKHAPATLGGVAGSNYYGDCVKDALYGKGIKDYSLCGADDNCKFNLALENKDFQACLSSGIKNEYTKLSCLYNTDKKQIDLNTCKTFKKKETIQECEAAVFFNQAIKNKSQKSCAEITQKFNYLGYHVVSPKELEKECNELLK